MPIYEYKCSKCDHEYELIQKMSDEPIVECQNCHQPTAKRLVSAPGFQLKGTGWYETDFKHKGKPPIAKAEDKVSASTETKPAVSETSKTKVKDESK